MNKLASLSPLWTQHKAGIAWKTLEGRQQEIPLEVALLHIVGSRNPAPKGIVRLLDWFKLPKEVLLVLEQPVSSS
ncbi:hypothetical protein SKAU_G00135350 [Synaphobranchus kaupii]|uniref:Uncharacterized protein n=1 Tax=Synaphobranchus kaupii TaxID=118154 RepID=A0A9Q1FRF5_SYNKA|nr:hypothetical protein SKAU_G00135350 [Synaphobranchus kaupii]